MEAKRTVGMVLFDGFELLDVFGPLEFFGRYPEQFEILMLAEGMGAIRSAQGPAAMADIDLANCLPLDILIVPGGRGTRREVYNESLIAELRRLAENAQYVTSVCTGAGLLAKAGLLDGKRATTNKLAYAWATSQGPKVYWVPEARWVEDGNVFTSAGVSAGMDMALALIAKILGIETAREAAVYTEYIWNEDPSSDPFAHLAGLVD
ncbi:ThiJ/PfpI family protein [Cerasicoccus arenae]|uniref:ThiJ/PfpI family protein n=2 Tax=Cerasicoccus arenae TaxID=424488 RepID=A0A8J3DJS5_9BACT|nr:DJ-1/PfpI family protein [Cerasicoccus arenae]GHC11705.1 ThiJ/PfpI family protein [Cerasicoccus arenae]